MSNTMKLCGRTLTILLIYSLGLWLSIQFTAFAGSSGSKVMVYLAMAFGYFIYLAIGIVVGTAVSPRFVKNRKTWIYIIPTIIFIIVGSSTLLFTLLPMLHIPPVIVQYFTNFTQISWVLSGIFATQAFR